MTCIVEFSQIACQHKDSLCCGKRWMRLPFTRDVLSQLIKTWCGRSTRGVSLLFFGGAQFWRSDACTHPLLLWWCSDDLFSQKVIHACQHLSVGTPSPVLVLCPYLQPMDPPLAVSIPIVVAQVSLVQFTLYSASSHSWAKLDICPARWRKRRWRQPKPRRLRRPEVRVSTQLKS